LFLGHPKSIDTPNCVGVLRDPSDPDSDHHFNIHADGYPDRDTYGHANPNGHTDVRRQRTGWKGNAARFSQFFDPIGGKNPACCDWRRGRGGVGFN
jgi:hypothetical protein